MNFSGHSGEIINARQIGDFCLTENIYAPQTFVPKHFHQKACFCFLIQGSYTEIFGRKAIEGKPSNLIFRPAGEIHSDYFGSAKTQSLIIEFENGWLEKFGKNIIKPDEPDQFQDKSLFWLAMKLRRESQNLDSFTDLTVEGLMLELVAEVGRKTLKFSESKLPCWLKRAKEILHENFTCRLSLSEIAETIGVHPVYLAGQFKKHFRCTMGEYTRRLRIESASRELSETDASLAEIGFAAGFAHQAHFLRAFKQLTGFTPAEFRAASRRQS